ncbi:hypothetical protein BH24ACI3_BH24ACI3_09590 [soil metagenome]
MNLSILKFTALVRSVSMIRFGVLCIAAALSLACGSEPESPSIANVGKTHVSDSTAANAADAASMPDTDRGLCANEFYPINTSLAREYRITGTAPASYTLTQENAGEDGFTETRNFGDGLTVKNSWVCTEEGLRNAEYTNITTMKEAEFEMETLKSSGVTIPNDWSVGSEWRTDYDIVAKIVAGPVNARADGKVLLTNKLISIDDTVTIDGKKYTAAKL